MLHDCWFLTGPTASGKSSVGVELARRLGAEVISMDSAAVYRGMDIGTAKPTVAERRAVPHHLIDICEPSEEFSLAQYIAAARRCVADIAARGRPALFVGGTPLYLKGLLRGIFEGPPADWALRRRLADESARGGPGWLHERLAAIDPAAAARLHPNDARRLIRAIEVFEKTGRPISDLQRQFEQGRSPQQCRVFTLDWPKAELLSRIERRVAEMFSTGLVEEVRRLIGPLSLWERDSAGPLSLWERDRVRAVGAEDADGPHPLPLSQRERGDDLLPLSQRERGVTLSRTARQAVGYREVIEYLEGRRGLSETVELVRLHTHQLAKRQSTWFRSLSECRWIAVSCPLDAPGVAHRIIALDASTASAGPESQQ
jgi:tRNA dimethylallyltransferase